LNEDVERAWRHYVGGIDEFAPSNSLPCLQGRVLGGVSTCRKLSRKGSPPSTFSCLQEKKEKNAPLQVGG